MLKHILSSIWLAIVKTVNHDGVEHAGYMSFMVILSLFPFCVFMLALTSFIGAMELGEHFIDMMINNIPYEAVESFSQQIKDMLSTPPPSLMTLAVAGTIWTSSSYLECIRTILNRVYEVTSPPNYIFRRLLSIVQFLVLSFAITILMFTLLLVPAILSKFPTLNEILINYLNEFGLIVNFTRYILAYLILFGTCSLLYYVLPNTKMRIIEVLPGAAIVVGLWGICGSLLSSYIKFYNNLNLIYGSLGSIIITMLFFYVVNMIFIYGAELNYLLFRKCTHAQNDTKLP